MSASTICHLQILVTDVFECMFLFPEFTFGDYVRAPPCQMRNRRRNQGKQHNRSLLNETVLRGFLNDGVFRRGLKV